MSAAPRMTLIDGERGEHVPAIDRGMAYGDGLFETIACRGGRPRFVDLHMGRLRAGCERLAIPFADWPALHTDIATVCAASAPAAIIKVLVTRGDAVKRGYTFTGDERPRRIVMAWPADTDGSAAMPTNVTVGLATTPVAENAGLAGLKHLNRLDSVLARAEADRHGWFDTMMLAADGAVACASTANVFAVRAGTVTTPQLSRFGVAGVMRRVALREAAALNIAASEATLSWHDLVEADELFLTNARIGVVPVSRLVDATREWRAFAPGQVALRLAARIEALDA